MARVEGMTCPNIARQLGVSKATVERDISTALRHCYRALADQGKKIMSANRPIPDSGIRVSGQILDQAIDWTLKMRFNTPDEKTRQEFKAWLEGDSRNPGGMAAVAKPPTRGLTFCRGPILQIFLKPLKKKNAPGA